MYKIVRYCIQLLFYHFEQPDYITESAITVIIFLVDDSVSRGSICQRATRRGKAACWLDRTHGVFKSGFLIGSMRSWRGVSGPSQKWLKLCVVSRLDPNGPKMTLF